MRAVFENRNICLELIGPFLTSKELGRFLCTCKKLYSFSPAYFTTIRDCWWKFGKPKKKEARERWVEECVKRNDIQALCYFCEEQIIRETNRFGKLSLMTHLSESLIENAAKYGSRDTLDWAIEKYLEFQKDGEIITPLDHIVPQSILSAIVEGNDDRALDLIGRFDDTIFSEMGIRMVLPFSVRLYEAVLCHGSGDALYKIARSKAEEFDEDLPDDENLFLVLGQGTSTRYLPILLEQQEDEIHAEQCLEYALLNPDPQMFEFVMRHFPLSELEHCYTTYKAGYIECRNELKEATKMVHIASAAEAIVRIQARIELMERYYHRFFERVWPQLIPREEPVDYGRWIKKQKLY